jgi:hypothetical protein
MWPSLRDGAIMMSFVLCVGLAAAAQTGGRDLHGTGTSYMDQATGGLARFQANWVPDSGSRSLGINRRRGALPLSEEQRSRIYESIMRMADAPDAAASVPELAEAVPSDVPLQDLPAVVTDEIPLVQGHKFVKLDDRILVVDPTSRIVVAMIPRYKLLQ